MPKLTLTIPAPQVGINQTYKATAVYGPNGKPKGRLYTATEAKQYKESIGYYVNNAVALQGVEFVDKTPTHITMTLYYPNLRRDLDSFAKLVTDSICAGIGVNDRYVFSLSMMKMIVRGLSEAYLEIEIIQREETVNDYEKRHCETVR